MSGEASAGAAGDAPPLDERDLEPRTPMKRLGSTRKLAAFNNIKLQLAEQGRVLEARAEASAGVAGELHDYCRRRGELEHEYARALEKLARVAHARHKEQRHKRDQWPLTGAFECWQAALEATRSLAREHAAVAELYGGVLAARLQRAADDALRLHRKCRDILQERHSELGAALQAAAAAGKEHAALHAEWRAAAGKLRLARLAREDPPKHKKVKALDKELEKRRARHVAARGRALRARVEYVLSLEAANATLQRYYLDDVADIILCMEVGFEAVVGRVVRCMSHAESARGAGAGSAAAALRRQADALDALHDRARLMHAHAAAFSLPRPLPPAPAHDVPEEEEQEREGEEDAELGAELAARLQQLEAGARQLRAECQESAKTLDAAEEELVRQMEGGDEHWDVTALFGAGALGLAPSAPALPAPPAPAEDQEDYYLAKFRAYVACAGRLARLDTKAGALRSGAVLASSPVPPPPRPLSPPRRAPRPAPAARAAAGPRSLFAAPQSETELPRVLTECVRVISTYGVRQQGVFRVSGSQVEMQALRAAFERGEDPLRGARDASDVNSVCGLLKMYLRGVRPPLLPAALAERLARLAALPEDGTFAARLRGTLAALPLHSLLVLRYLFAFLAHLARHSRHNMMDPWNLAICVGPTLLAAPPAPAHQLAHQNLLNELVKRTIVHHQEVFPQDVAPHALYRPPPSDDEEEEEEEEGEEQPDGAPPQAPAAAPPQEPDTDDESSSEPDSGEWGADARAPPSPGSGLAERRGSQVPPSPSAAAPPAPVEPPDSPPAAIEPPGAGTPPSSPPCRRLLADSTPDLVLDLPLRAPPAPPPTTPSQGVVGAPLAPHAPLDAADTFAHNRDTLKKRPAHTHRSGSEGAEGAESAGGAEGAESVESGAGGSPVPVRNTARVCAKFAELTLTGGSLKPALAAKPALLRRPTPHPRPAALQPLEEPHKEPHAEP